MAVKRKGLPARGQFIARVEWSNTMEIKSENEWGAKIDELFNFTFLSNFLVVRLSFAHGWRRRALTFSSARHRLSTNVSYISIFRLRCQLTLNNTRTHAGQSCLKKSESIGNVVVHGRTQFLMRSWPFEPKQQGMRRVISRKKREKDSLVVTLWMIIHSQKPSCKKHLQPEDKNEGGEEANIIKLWNFIKVYYSCSGTGNIIPCRAEIRDIICKTMTSQCFASHSNWFYLFLHFFFSSGRRSAFKPPPVDLFNI